MGQDSFITLSAMLTRLTRLLHQYVQDPSLKKEIEILLKKIEMFSPSLGESLAKDSMNCIQLAMIFLKNPQDKEVVNKIYERLLELKNALREF